MIVYGFSVSDDIQLSLWLLSAGLNISFLFWVSFVYPCRIFFYPPHLNITMNILVPYTGLCIWFVTWLCSSFYYHSLVDRMIK